MGVKLADFLDEERRILGHIRDPLEQAVAGLLIGHGRGDFEQVNKTLVLEALFSVPIHDHNPEDGGIDNGFKEGGLQARLFLRPRQFDDFGAEGVVGLAQLAGAPGDEALQLIHFPLNC